MAIRKLSHKKLNFYPMIRRNPCTFATVMPGTHAESGTGVPPVIAGPIRHMGARQRRDAAATGGADKEWHRRPAGDRAMSGLIIPLFTWN